MKFSFEYTQDTFHTLISIRLNHFRHERHFSQILLKCKYVLPSHITTKSLPHNRMRTHNCSEISSEFKNELKDNLSSFLN